MPIRLASIENIPAISALISRSIRTINANEHSPEQMAIILGLHDEAHFAAYFDRRQVFVLQGLDQLIGTVALEDATLHTLFVDPPFATQGHGKALVHHIVELARSRGLETLKVSSSMTAVAFYEKLGFQKKHLRQHDFGTTWAMEKQL
jgi:GNAT superfamily N-acetyltransferase